jgi:hypothetical protein
VSIKKSTKEVPWLSAAGISKWAHWLSTKKSTKEFAKWAVNHHSEEMLLVFVWYYEAGNGLVSELSTSTNTINFTVHFLGIVFYL